MATKEDHERLGVWAAMMEPDLNIDRRTCKRTVPMQVLSLGLPRTGTASMQEAYSILGYADPYHFSSVFVNTKDGDMWKEALKIKLSGQGKPYGRAEFDKLLGHCSAVTDVPCCIMWKELLDAYPEAKVVLVERDEKKWNTSFGVLVDGMLNPFGRYVLSNLDPFWWGRIVGSGYLWLKVFVGTNNAAVAKERALDTYRKHYRDIRAAVPKDRLLNYKLGSGWEPLCEFLGKPVPDVPFPHRNEADILENAFGMAILKALKHSAVNLAGMVAVGFGVYKLVQYVQAS